MGVGGGAWRGAERRGGAGHNVPVKINSVTVPRAALFLSLFWF